MSKNADELAYLFDAPLARKSEYKVGEQASYRSGKQIVTGQVLYVADGEGGQLYLIENPDAGFPDVVRAGELEAPNGE